jgi:hypothetical protein
MKIITGKCEVRETGSGVGRPQGLLRLLDFLVVLPERRRIRRTCVDTLREYRRLRDQMQVHQDSRREVYAHVVAALCGIQDMRAALDTVRRAEESFAMWPVERQPCLRDIAQYLAMTDRLRIDVMLNGVSSRAVEIGRLVAAKVIPENLG